MSMIEPEDVDGRKRLHERYDFYKKEAEEQNYHIPYEYYDEMTKILNLSIIEYRSEEYDEWLWKIYNLGMFFRYML